MASNQAKTRQRPHTASGAKKLLAVAALATDLRDGVMRFNRRLRQARPVGDLTQSQLSVLTSLELAGALTPRELAEAERVRPPTMTKIVARLEEIGVVQRTPHPTDGRQVILSATPRGREALAETRRARDAWLTKQLTALSDGERDTLRAAVEIITRIARDDTPEAPQR
jgi:DNA-binding MarR family transcriptional regulator